MSDRMEMPVIPPKDGVEYGRRVLGHEIDRLKRFEDQATEEGAEDRAERWRYRRTWLERMVGPGEGCVITAFDARWLDDDFRAIYESAFAGASQEPKGRSE